MTFTVLSGEETITILGPNNNYIEIPFPTPKEILERNFKKNLNAYFLFQTDLKREIKKLKNSSTQFDEFINNIPIIWEKTPEIIKNRYKVLSEEVEKLNKHSGLKILSFDPKSFVDKDVYSMEPKMNPPVLNSVTPSLEVSERNNIFMSPPDESFVVPQFQYMETDIPMKDTVDTVLNSTPPPDVMWIPPTDVSYSLIPPIPLPDGSYSLIPPTPFPDVSYSLIPPISLPDGSYSLIPPTPFPDVSYYVHLPSSQTQFPEIDVSMNSNLIPDPPPDM
ncbi:hypothetical protein RhiirA5_408797 [Rhizophagus irregularis]|uniref:MATA-HMG n=1 Tax=Rhizophagus irregularis TaxID=588596 RepID=A0A2N0Q7A3_9GLOM|nr:hypothetical protein RhiirA5_408797 [Rhizophagus irregularis]